MREKAMVGKQGMLSTRYTNQNITFMQEILRQNRCVLSIGDSVQAAGLGYKNLGIGIPWSLTGKMKSGAR